jgi:hypothetical protein
VAVALRSPDEVMQLQRMGAFHQTRLSFMRVLLRQMSASEWRVHRTVWDVNAAGVGTAMYQVDMPERSYTLVAFAHDLDPALRSDRVIAQAWDATFTLYDGVPDAPTVERLRAQVPLQEAGRISEQELTLARANRSVRLFEYVISALASGHQPDAEELASTGYLMRTTAVYGSGKFGAIDRRFIRARPELRRPFQAELLSVYLIRLFTFDIVNHMAATRAPDTAVSLAPHLCEQLGIGNSTGLGMAPFIANHPRLVDRWMTARETALARVRNKSDVSRADVERLVSYIRRLQSDTDNWHTDHAQQAAKVAALKSDLVALSAYVSDTLGLASMRRPWDALYQWTNQHCSLEAQEALVSLLIELYPALVDALSQRMFVDEPSAVAIDAQMSAGRLRDLIEQHYGYVLETDFDDVSATARFWYTSEEKLEPRLGERYEEDGAQLEHPLAVGRDISRLYMIVGEYERSTTLATVLQAHPDVRHTVRRAQDAARYPYGEIRDNTIAADMQPIDILRCKLSFFGATRFDPRSDRWVRITMFQNAPLPDGDSGLLDACDQWVLQRPGVAA